MWTVQEGPAIVTNDVKIDSWCGTDQGLEIDT